MTIIRAVLHIGIEYCCFDRLFRQVIEVRLAEFSLEGGLIRQDNRCRTSPDGPRAGHGPVTSRIVKRRNRIFAQPSRGWGMADSGFLGDSEYSERCQRSDNASEPVCVNTAL